MSPHKSDRASRNTTSKQPSTTLKVGVETSDPPTIVHLLASHDADVVRTTLSAACSACETNPSCFAKLASESSVWKNLSALLGIKDEAVLRQVVYLVNGVLEVKAVMLVHEVDGAFAKLTNVYLQSVDSPIVVKLVLSSMLKVLDWYPENAPFVFDPSLVNRLLDMAKRTPEEDVKTKCVRLVIMLVVDEEQVEKLVNLPNFAPAVFVCFLKEFQELRRLILDFLAKLAGTEVAIKPLYTMAPVLIDLLADESQAPLYPDALALCTLILNNEESCTKFITLEQFFLLLSYATRCPEEHRLHLLSLLRNFSKYGAPEYRQKLHNYGLERAVLHTLGSNREDVLCEAAGVMTELCNHTYGVATMVNEETIDRLVYMFESNNAGMIRGAAPLVQKLLARNERTLGLFAKKGAPAVVGALLRHSKGLSEEILDKLLFVVQMYVAHPIYKEKTVFEDLLVKLMSIYESSSDDLAIRASHILNDLFVDSLCRSAFCKMSGHKILMAKLETTDCEQLVKNTLTMIKTLIVYKNANDLFSRAGLVPLLSKFETRYICASLIVNALCSLYLPLKFHKTNELSITDKIRNNFYLIDGEWTDEFPFLERLVKEGRSTQSTIYVVDYSYTRRVEVAPKAPDKPTIAPVNYAGITEDPYLYDYFLELGDLLSGGLEDKLRTIARYVADKLTGYVEKPRHVLPLHLSALKEKLGSNMIPIGFLRHGSVCERALLFKVLADRFDVPASLRRRKGVYWNDAAFVRDEEEEGRGHVAFRVVDLFNEIGATYEMDDEKGATYMEFLAKRKGF